MKAFLASAMLFTSLSALANSPGIVCRDDQRLGGGSSTELVLMSTPQGYFLQTVFVPSLQSTDIQMEVLAKDLDCKTDIKAKVAFCQSSDGQTMVNFIARSESSYDSVDPDANKSNKKYVDIMVTTADGESKKMSFTANLCQAFDDKE